MKPVVPTAKRSTGFSIDSLIGPQTTHSKTTVASKVSTSSTGSEHPRVQTLNMGSMGFMGRVPPPHLGLPINFKNVYPDNNVNQELLALRSAWGLMGSQLETMQHLSHNPLIPNSLPVNPNLLHGPRDPSLHLYPLLMTRQNPCFSYPFPGVHDAGLLFHPYRKPKRIRTAFSPSQLLKLEDAFDKNHYVVGQERKDLAVKLSLTETQVKVWFQNRRTKCKRVKGEGDEDDLQTQNQSLSDKSDDEQDNSDMMSHANDIRQPTDSTD